jgi:hypothetical protein
MSRPVVGGSAQPVHITGSDTVLGDASAANQASQLILTGAVTETAPATDTAPSGLNGRLQRIAQRITSLIALLPAALTGSGNFKTALQEAIPTGTNAIGKVDASPGVPTIFTVTTATSATQFASTAAALVEFKARTSNTGLAYIGDANDVAAGNGYELAAGEVFSWYPATNTNLFWHISTNATDKIDVRVKAAP